MAKNRETLLINKKKYEFFDRIAGVQILVKSSVATCRLTLYDNLSEEEIFFYIYFYIL